MTSCREPEDKTAPCEHCESVHPQDEEALLDARKLAFDALEDAAARAEHKGDVATAWRLRGMADVLIADHCGDHLCAKAHGQCEAYSRGRADAVAIGAHALGIPTAGWGSA